MTEPALTGQEQLALGIEQLEISHAEWLRQVRKYARHFCSVNARVSSDALRRAEKRDELRTPHHPNAWGAVFREKSKDGHWERTGTKKSTYSSNHGRLIGVWRWRPR